MCLYNIQGENLVEIKDMLSVESSWPLEKNQKTRPETEYFFVEGGGLEVGGAHKNVFNLYGWLGEGYPDLRSPIGGCVKGILT